MEAAHFTLIQVILIKSILLYPTRNSKIQESLKAKLTLNIAYRHHYFIIGMGGRCNLHSDENQSPRFGCPFEPRSWDLQSARLGCHPRDFYVIGFNPIPLDEHAVYSLSTITDPFYNLEILLFESNYIMVLSPTNMWRPIITLCPTNI